ncbi:hypothetical protein D9758_007602 [Tetrapyrgos nigripes]|uniref:O-methyltransferase C-terminal domain-containing protein n=1 Tax=Tetrapyrgos nigripes TaxID=182062 RepID=A0A8H5LK60_9AGAR|nr:hypothetical protein D9758_007602 [Tetrapyrgos nigripes]
MTQMSSISELDSLQETLNSAIDTIREELKANKLPELSTLATEPHPYDSASTLPTPKFYQAQITAIAALTRLDALIQNPYKRITTQVYAVYETSALYVTVKVGVVDALANAPDVSKGLSISELQSKLDVDGAKLAIILRLLTTRGWFHETSEGVFAITRPTLQLREGTNGWKAVLTPGKPKVADSLYQMITHPQWKYSQDSKQTAYQLAHDTDLIMFDHLYKYAPDTAKLFANSIKSLGDEFSPGLLEDFPWSQLDGRTIVDCGGGQGSMTLLIVPKMPKSSFVIQDLAGPLELAKKNLETTLPDDWNAGRVKLEEHDFFKAQTQQGSDKVFIFRWVLHDWPDDEAVRILSNVAKGGGKGAKVLIIEFIIIPGTISISSSPALAAPAGSDTIAQLPPYIPADYGQVSTIAHDMGAHMLAILNARERTLVGFKYYFITDSDTNLILRPSTSL